MKNKAICIMMVLMLTITPSYKAYADAGSITIAGGTIGVGGVAGGALAGLAGPAVVAVFVGMMAVGMDVELTKQSQQAGMTKTQFVKSKIEQYCQEAGKTADVFYKGITNGTRVLQNGSLAFTDAASLQIKQFINWLYSNNDVALPNQGTNGESINLNGLNLPYSSSFQFTGTSGNVFAYTTSVSCCWFQVKKNGSSTNGLPVCVSNESFTLNVTRNGSAYQSAQSRSYNGYYYQFFSSLYEDISNGRINLPVYENGVDETAVQNFINGINVWNPGGLSPTSDTFTGTQNPDTSAYDPTQGWPTVVNPGVVGQIPIPADTDITVNVREYLEKLQEVLDQLKDRVIEGVDQADGIPKDWDIPDTVEANPTIGKQPPTPDSDTTPVSNNDPPSPSTEPNIASGPLKFNLTEIFPFCIPFDIKDMIGLLQADPVAPAYTVNWNIPIVNVPLNFTVDLSPWNSVATICRKMELLLFIIGLAMVTRNLIRG